MSTSDGNSRGSETTTEPPEAVATRKTNTLVLRYDQFVDKEDYEKEIRKKRGKANDFYAVASTAVIGIYINHFLSSLDAVWSASLYNKNIAMKVRVQQNDFADHTEYIPTINLQFNF